MPKTEASIRVDLGDRSYDIVVGEGLLEVAGHHLRPLLPQPRVVVVTDTNVEPLYLKKLTASLDQAGIAHASLTLPAGEHTKDFMHLQDLVERLLGESVERGTTLVALGGGVIGDITGFAAGILLRGVNFVQIPTTLLAQVDSSVGGKTGINSRQGKNLVGLFHQPRLVLADVRTLGTLDARQMRAGYAEVVKYGLINNAEFFSWLEAHGAEVCDGDPRAQTHAVLTSCSAKAEIVAADEKEAGERALLNLGHTFGHAFEAEIGYGDALLHGEAVAIGMVMACDFSVRLGLCPAEDAGRVRRHLQTMCLPTDPAAVPAARWSADALVDQMNRDKKVRDGQLTLVLLRGIGQSFISREVAVNEVFRFIQDSVAA
jgi:3-dehydroquinate synthase